MTTQVVSSDIPRLEAGQAVGDFEVLKLIKAGGQGILYLMCPILPSDTTRRLLRFQMSMFGATQRLTQKYQLGVLKFSRPAYEANLHDERGYLALPEAEHDHLGRTYSRRYGMSTRRRARADLAFAELIDRNGNRDSYPYITLAYEPGGSVKDLMERRRYKPLTAAQAVKIGIQIAEAVAHLHTRLRLVHHDISPANMMFHERLSALRSKEPWMVLVDLAAAESIDKPRQRSIYGVKIYMPPERLKDTPDPISEHIDIYALGMVLYELMTGRLDDQPTRDLRDTSRRIPPLVERLPSVSAELNAVITGATERDLGLRKRAVPNMAAMAHALRNVPEAQLDGTIRAPLTSRFIMKMTGLALAVILPLVLAAVLLASALGAPAAPTATPTPEQPTAEAVETTAPTQAPTVVETPRPTAVPTSTRVPRRTPTPTPTP